MKGFKKLKTINTILWLFSLSLRDCCSASHQAAHLSYLLVIAQNKPERTSEGLSFQPQKDLNTLFSSVSLPMLIYSVWFVYLSDKMADLAFDWSVEGSIEKQRP